MKHLILIILISISTAAGNPLIMDSSHVFHVAKDGNDSNAGHAQQYPINFAADAKLTIGAAVTAAANGDTIIIWPGDYVETVNLDSANKSLILIGTHRDKCRITPSADDAVIIEDNTQLYNLSFITEVATKRGIEGTSKSNIIIDNCYVYGPYDGIYLVGGSNIRITNTYAKGTYDAANITINGLFIDNCIFETNGEDPITVNALLVGSTSALDDAGRIIRHTIFRAVRTVSSSNPIYGLTCGKGKMILENCQLVAVTKTDATGNAQALRAYHAAYSSEIVANNCNFYSSSNGGTALDIYANKSSKIVLLNCLYNRSKITIADSASVVSITDDKGRVAVETIKGTE